MVLLHFINNQIELVACIDIIVVNGPLHGLSVLKLAIVCLSRAIHTFSPSLKTAARKRLLDVVAITASELVFADAKLPTELQGVSLAGADLSNCDLSRCNLTGANLTGANLTRTNLTDAQLTGASLTGNVLELCCARRVDLVLAVHTLISERHPSLQSFARSNSNESHSL